MDYFCAFFFLHPPLHSDVLKGTPVDEEQVRDPREINSLSEESVHCVVMEMLQLLDNKSKTTKTGEMK